ncbi:alcohol dehydrogenase [Gordoniibacillus kamchatkensis]|uniref:Alcohol dehydrogenase n=1 Tax=Gordoniibacillus kamchatkensis TaxID=1590651 RepID=A0ABR5AL84_9BACL|nr:iron-containing alcohol dehydrogenase [Paenibacillus sp. VKM B-2647]KIL41692.1 alcohol dehydrogenase [Paenibacillus sp. VKM B-2647]
MFQLLMPPTVLYGKGAFAEVGKQAAMLGRKALIVSDPVMAKLNVVAQCEAYLHEQQLASAAYTGVDAEPTDRHVQEALERCRSENCDVIVAVGGGSCIDTAKAVAALMTNEGSIADFAGSGGGRLFAHDPLPLVAVPTTAGTGSEVTKVTVIIHRSTDVKMMISHPQLLPRAAIVDPLLTLSCPPNVTAATGIDALCHAIEAFISRKAQPVTDIYARSAIELIMMHLRTAYKQGNDIAARENVALGSMLAGAAFSNASVTLVHGMSRPLGALFHVPHGVSNAMLLPAVLDFTKASAPRKFAQIGRLLVHDAEEMPEERLADYALGEIRRLCTDLNIPDMKMWGIDEAQFHRLAPKMAHDALQSGSPANNPRVPTAEEIIRLYEVAYNYREAHGD